MNSVLIVDDAEISRRSIKRSKLWGESSDFYIAGEAGNGEEALEMLKDSTYDLIIADIKMPKMDGIELLKRVTESRLCPYVVLLSDFTEYRYARQGLIYGAFDYIGKPLNDAELAKLFARVKKDQQERQKLKGGDIGQELLTQPIIRCFGRFEFSVGNQEINFVTHKAKEVFIYILCNQYRQISRDELIEIFFNTGDEKRDANNLRVTIFRIRQTLQSANIGKEHLLLKEDYAARTAPGVCDVVDFFNFVSQNKMINRSNIATANKIINMINGAFLSDMDDVWVNDVRANIAVAMENILIKMAIYYNFGSFKPSKAEYLLIKLIEINPLSEQGHLALLDLCIKTNDIGKYIYYYRRYRENLKKELDCEPEMKYRDLYEKFTK